MTLINTSLWIAQIVLAALLCWAAAAKLLMPPAKLAAMWPWTASNRTLTTSTGILDLLAALGLVLPAIPGMMPHSAFYTALGLILLMIAAIIFHVNRGEAKQIGFNIFVLAVAVFIGWFRR